jgi:hypothetical protein
VVRFAVRYVSTNAKRSVRRHKNIRGPGQSAQGRTSYFLPSICLMTPEKSRVPMWLSTIFW